MSQQSYLLDKKDRNWIVRILKWIFFVTAFVLIGITVLGNMSGNGDHLKQSVEKFFSDIFQGRPVTVNKLVHMSFFPKIGFDAEEIEVLLKPESHPILEIGKIQVFMGFWNVAMRIPKVSAFYVENLQAIKGALAPHEFFAEKIFIDHDIEAKQAQLRGNGKIGVHPWSMSMEVEVHGKAGNYSYMPMREFPVMIEIADIKFEAFFINGLDYYKLENFKLSSDTQSIQGDITLSALGEKLLKLKGRIATGGDTSIILPDMIMDYSQFPVKVSGTLSSEKLLIEDLFGSNASFSIFSRIRDLVGYEGSFSAAGEGLFENYNLDLQFDLQNVVDGEKSSPQLRFPVLVDGANGLKFGPVRDTDEILPAILLLPVDDQIVVVVQDGPINSKVLKDWFTGMSDDIEDQYMSECGVMKIPYSDKGYVFESASVNIADGSMNIADQEIADFSEIFDLKIKVSKEKNEISPMMFEKPIYDFIQSSLRGSSSESLCVPYFTQTPLETNENASESEQVQ